MAQNDMLEKRTKQPARAVTHWPPLPQQPQHRRLSRTATASGSVTDLIAHESLLVRIKNVGDGFPLSVLFLPHHYVLALNCDGSSVASI